MPELEVTCLNDGGALDPCKTISYQHILANIGQAEARLLLVIISCYEGIILCKRMIF